MEMEKESTKTKRIAKNTIVLYFRMLFLMAISLYTGRVVLDALGIDDYGVYNVVGGFVAMFAIMSSALTSANSRFLNYEMGQGNTGRLKIVFSSLVTIQFALAILIFISCEIIGNWYVGNKMVLPPDRLNAAIWCLHFSIFNFCMDLVSVPYRAAIVAHEKMKAFAYVSIFEGLAKLGVCYLIMVMPYDRLVVYALLLLIVQFIVRFAYQAYCWRFFSECHYKFVIDSVLLKKMFAYSGWHFVGNSAAVLKNQGVNVVLNLFFGTAVNAAKGVSNQVLNAVQGFARNFMIALNPQITQSYAKGDYEYMMKLVFKGARFSFYVLMFVSLPIIINADFLLHVWLKDVPRYAIPFAQLTLVVAIITSLSNPLMTAQNATGNVRNYQLIVGGVQLLDLPISCVVLYCGFSPVSVMFVAIAVEIASLVARLFMIPRYIPQFKAWDFFTNVVINCLVVFVLSMSVPLIMDIFMDVNKINFVLNLLSCLFLSAIVILFVGCSKQERSTLVLKTKNFLRKRG